MSVYTEVQEERERQDEKWGGPDHDDHHTVAEWKNFIVEHAYKANDAAYRGDVGEARQHLVEVAALAVAAVEALDRITGEPGE